MTDFTAQRAYAGEKNGFHFYQNEKHVPVYLERNTTVPYINITSRQLMQKVAEKQSNTQVKNRHRQRV